MILISFSDKLTILTYPISKKICLNCALTFIKGWRCPDVGIIPCASKLYGLNCFVFQEPLKNKQSIPTVGYHHKRLRTERQNITILIILENNYPGIHFITHLANMSAVKSASSFVGDVLNSLPFVTWKLLMILTNWDEMIHSISVENNIVIQNSKTIKKW